jgi:TonB family protein
VSKVEPNAPRRPARRPTRRQRPTNAAPAASPPAESGAPSAFPETRRDPGGPGAGALLLAFLASVAFNAAFAFALMNLPAPETPETQPDVRTELADEEVLKKAEVEELLPAEMRREEPRLVQINPDAPNTPPPEDTLNHGAANQRAAQKKPDADAQGNKPRNDGEDAFSMRVSQNIPRELIARPMPVPGVPLGNPSRETEQATTPPPPPPAPVSTPDKDPAQARIEGPKADQSAAPAPPESPVAGAPDGSGLRVEALPVPRSAGTATDHKGSPKPPDAAQPPTASAPAPVTAPTPTSAPVEDMKEKPTAVKSDAKPDPNARPETKPVPKPEPPRPPAPTTPTQRSTDIARPLDVMPVGEVPEMQRPLPRPQAAKVGTTGMLLKSTTGVSTAGTVALDAKFSEFGDYGQRFMEVIQASWWEIILRGNIRGQGGDVTVAFTLCANGSVKDVKILSSSAHEVATYACKDAIEARAPYEKWPPAMREMLGAEFHTSCRFSYR